MNLLCTGSQTIWTNSVYLIIYENHNNKLREKLNGDGALDKIEKLGGSKEKILESKIWMHSLYRYIPPILGVWHEFTIVKSTNYYWSFEKNMSGIYIQRSKDIEDVMKMINGKERTASAWPEGRFNFDIQFEENIIDIIKWIINKNELNIDYHVNEHNCHYFASELYEAVVRDKELSLSDRR